MKISKRHLRRLVKEARFGMQMPRGSQPPLDVPMRDSGPVPKDQLRKLADIFMKDMGMSADEVLQNPEFVEQGITDLRQLGERKIKITKRQLKRIIKEEKAQLINEGFFDSLSDLGKKAMSGLGIGAEDVSDEMSADAAQEALDKAFFQYAVSIASQQGDVTGESIEAAQQRALKHVQSLTGHKVMR